MRLAASLLVTVILAMALAAAQPAATQPEPDSGLLERALPYIPDDGRLVLIIPSIGRLAEGVAAFGRGIGVPDVADVTPRQLLEELLGKSAAGVNARGPLILALSPGQDEPILIATLASEEAWQSTTKPTGTLQRATLYEFGAERYSAATIGQVAIFAREREELRRAVEAQGTFATRFADELRDGASQRQALVIIDVSAWKSEIETQLATLAQGLCMGMAAAGPDAELGMQIWNWLLARARLATAEARALVATLRIQGDGVFVTLRALLQNDGRLSRYLGAIKAPEADLLRGVPAGDSPLVVAVEWKEPAEGEGFGEEFAKFLLESPALKERVPREKLEVALERNVALNRKTTGTSAAFAFSPEGKGLMYWGLYLTQDAESVRQGMREICELAPELMNAWGAFPTALLQHELERVSDTEVDVYKFDFSGEKSRLQPVMQAMYGRDPALLLAKHPQGLAYVFGPRESARPKLAQFLAKDSATLRDDPRVAALFRVLTPQPQFCVLLDIPALARAATSFVEGLGLPIPELDLPDEKAPLAGLAAYFAPASLRAELFVPAEPIKAIVKVAERFEGEGDKAY